MSRLGDALEALEANLRGLSAVDVRVNLDVPINWDKLAAGVRVINLKYGEWLPRTRCSQTAWFLAPVLELLVKADTHAALGPAMIALHEQVLGALAADRTLGGAASWCEQHEGVAAPVEVGARPERGAVMGLGLTLEIIVATSSRDVSAGSGAA